MITGFSVRNFKNLAAVPEEEGKLIEFGPVNVLIGPNVQESSPEVPPPGPRPPVAAL